MTSGRIAVLENKPYNKYHNRKIASFFLFECIDDSETANALFEKALRMGAPARIEPASRDRRGSARSTVTEC